MNTTYALIYLVPSVFFLLGIWMVVRLLAELGAGVVWRRLCFVFLATLLVAPAVAGSIITVAWIPNGVILFAGDAPLLHQPRLVAFAGISFSLTAVISAAVAWLLIRQPHRNAPANNRVLRIGMPLAVIVGLVASFYTVFPDRDVPKHIDWTLLEPIFGDEMDAVLATLDIADIDELTKERKRLQASFEDDPIFWSVSFYDERLDDGVAGSSQFYVRLKSSSHSCSGSRHRKRIMRCTVNTNNFFDQETIRYGRSSLINGRVHSVTFEFDYDVFLERYPRAPDLTVDEATRLDQDRRLLGTWRLERAFNRNPGGNRVQTVTLKVGPRQTYCS